MGEMTLNQIWALVQPLAASAVRHGLTGLAVYLSAKGIPGLDDAAINGLTAAAVGGIGLGWSAIDKARRGKA